MENSKYNIIELMNYRIEDNALVPDRNSKVLIFEFHDEFNNINRYYYVNVNHYSTGIKQKYELKQLKNYFDILLLHQHELKKVDPLYRDSFKPRKIIAIHKKSQSRMKKRNNSFGKTDR